MELNYLLNLLVFISLILSVITQTVEPGKYHYSFYIGLKIILFYCIFMQYYACFSGCDGEADVVFAIDSSGFTNERDFEQSRDFVRTVVTRLQVRQEKTRVGVVALVDEGIQEMSLGQILDKNRMIDFIDRIPYRRGRGRSIDYPGFLNLIKSRVFMESEGGREVVPNVLVLVTSDSALDESK